MKKRTFGAGLKLTSEGETAREMGKEQAAETKHTSKSWDSKGSFRRIRGEKYQTSTYQGREGPDTLLLGQFLVHLVLVVVVEMEASKSFLLKGLLSSYL